MNLSQNLRGSFSFFFYKFLFKFLLFIYFGSLYYIKFKQLKPFPSIRAGVHCIFPDKQEKSTHLLIEIPIPHFQSNQLKDLSNEMPSCGLCASFIAVKPVCFILVLEYLVGRKKPCMGVSLTGKDLPFIIQPVRFVPSFQNLRPRLPNLLCFLQIADSPRFGIEIVGPVSQVFYKAKRMPVIRH